MQEVTGIQSEAPKQPKVQSLQPREGEASDSAWDQWQSVGFVPAHTAGGRERTNGNPVHASNGANMPCTPASKAVDQGGRDQGAASASQQELLSGSANNILEAHCESAMHMESPSSGIERGSCGVWNVSYDEGAAQQTVKKLGLKWHRQELRGHSVEQGAAHRSKEQVVKHETSTGNGDAGCTDRQNIDCSSVDSICAHTACSAKVTFQGLLGSLCCHILPLVD